MSNTWHVLNGDALLRQFPNLKGEKVVIRECMMDGPLSTDFNDDFWQNRADYIKNTFSAEDEDYVTKAKNEIERLSLIENGDQVYLWFEDDLFCQANLWFTLAFIEHLHPFSSVFYDLVRPNHLDWTGFGCMSNSDLLAAFDEREKLHPEHLDTFYLLWHSFVRGDSSVMEKCYSGLLKTLPRLTEIVLAIKDRLKSPPRPETSILQLYDTGHQTFGSLFKAFSKKEGVYGYSDLQVLDMIKKLKSNGDLANLVV